LWRLQGENRTWYCGSYFGSGFHEDALQAGLAAAEDAGGYAASLARRRRIRPHRARAGPGGPYDGGCRVDVHAPAIS
jgi:predicted NAD/FAD-binding protein